MTKMRVLKIIALSVEMKSMRLVLPAVTGSTVCWAGVVVDTLGSTQLQHSTISHLLGNNVNKCDY